MDVGLRCSKDVNKERGFVIKLSGHDFIRNARILLGINQRTICGIVSGPESIVEYSHLNKILSIIFYHYLPLYFNLF